MPDRISILPAIRLGCRQFLLHIAVIRAFLLRIPQHWTAADQSIGWFGNIYRISMEHL
jgi:hypothetical protein